MKEVAKEGETSTERLGSIILKALCHFSLDKVLLDV
jgi:hypothetical protein